MKCCDKLAKVNRFGHLVTENHYTYFNYHFYVDIYDGKGITITTTVPGQDLQHGHVPLALMEQKLRRLAESVSAWFKLHLTAKERRRLLKEVSRRKQF